LDGAIQELKETDFKDLFSEELAAKTKLIVQDCIIETDLEILIPETFVSNVSERLQLYSRLDNIKNEEQLTEYINEVKDRFGALPQSVIELINSVRLRWLGERLGFEKLSIKNERLRAYFISTNDSYFSSDTFGKILTYIKSHPKKCRLKDVSGKAQVIIEDIKSVDEAIILFHQMDDSFKISESEILSK
jgi:transcription-repair coupling factor (superfamily II helicase)